MLLGHTWGKGPENAGARAEWSLRPAADLPDHQNSSLRGALLHEVRAAMPAHLARRTQVMISERPSGKLHVGAR